MEITLKRINLDFLIVGKNPQGNKILLDNIRLENPEGISPMESVLMGLGSCSSLDILSILKKQRQKIEDFSVKIKAERKELKEAKPFKKIELNFYIKGEVDEEKAKKAAELSFEKYCSVSLSLNPEIEIIHRVFVNRED